MKKIGLALGGGGARGCAHIGAIKALEEAKIPIHYVAGTSIGAFVGGVYAVGQLDELAEYFAQIKWSDVVKQFDPTLRNSGMFKGEKVTKIINRFIKERSFKDCKIPFIAVATDLDSSEEIWFKEGNIATAIRASISLPGIFTVVDIKKRHLIDGGVVNPLPVNVVRDMGADVVIAIDLNKEYAEEKRKKRRSRKKDGWDFSKLLRPEYPNMVDVIENSIFLMQRSITEKNLEINPADVLVNMKLSSASLFDFHEAKPLMKQGYDQMKAQIPAVKKMLHA